MRVALWLARTEGLDADELTARLPPNRQAELAGYAPAARLHSAGAELLLMRAIGQLRPGLSLACGRGDKGKPWLLSDPSFHFNLSHSGSWAVCAVGDCPVGVDIQLQRPVRTDISRKFSSQERELLEALCGQQWIDAFFQLWAVKESFGKCRGTGLTRGLMRPVVSLPTGSVGEQGYTARLLPPPEVGYALAVCLAGTGKLGWHMEIVKL